LIHSIAHAESYAIDLMWDVIVRFVKMDMPKDYYDDWANVVFEEANHFESWANRLEDPDIDGKYGGMPGSELLWDAAQETSHDLLTRLAIGFL
jgi:uncharacterized ferritin-like protein (DUF455 family)